ncbi:iron-containing alcohol dehydrogenase [Alteromonas sp. C1M14]|uniref:iron-containing alcohol dehydrogenase n=1 Tax=Alteromonas sp. C1M14 TaxID=2841567 RepID=UPI001C0820C7|nr:iron-containing alcohol dehydrogenase [Alteromonas sp. C1M14]MBU2979900.1 iron-containing alcohol dehydrogenase [Alteromonas sp. C1M14]
MTISHWQVTVPDVTFGPGSVKHTLDLLKQQGLSRPMLVTDAGVLTQPFTKALIAQLEANHFLVSTFSEIKGNPTKSNVDLGVEYLQSANSDSIIALGGGSAIDVAKAMSLVARNKKDLWLFCYFEDPDTLPQLSASDDFVPMMIIPTTAGTGSELSGSSCVITDEVRGQKRVAYHPSHFPFAVIADPELLISLPKHLSAWTGMDALTHAIEAYCAPDFNPLCDGIALEAVRLCYEHLSESVNSIDLLPGRTQMMAASSIAAVAFTSKGLGAVHSIAHALGALLDIHHGLANAVVLPYVLKFNLSVIAPKLTRLANLLALPDRTAKGFIAWIEELRQQLAIPNTLKEIHVKPEQLPHIAALAYKDTEHQTNPVTMSEANFLHILKTAF